MVGQTRLASLRLVDKHFGQGGSDDSRARTPVATTVPNYSHPKVSSRRPSTAGRSSVSSEASQVSSPSMVLDEGSECSEFSSDEDHHFYRWFSDGSLPSKDVKYPALLESPAALQRFCGGESYARTLGDSAVVEPQRPKTPKTPKTPQTPQTTPQTPQSSQSPLSPHSAQSQRRNQQYSWPGCRSPARSPQKVLPRYTLFPPLAKLPQRPVLPPRSASLQQPLPNPYQLVLPPIPSHSQITLPLFSPTGMQSPLVVPTPPPLANALSNAPLSRLALSRPLPLLPSRRVRRPSVLGDVDEEPKPQDMIQSAPVSPFFFQHSQQQRQPLSATAQQHEPTIPFTAQTIRPSSLEPIQAPREYPFPVAARSRSATTSAGPNSHLAPSSAVCSAQPSPLGGSFSVQSPGPFIHSHYHDGPPSRSTTPKPLPPPPAPIMAPPPLPMAATMKPLEKEQEEEEEEEQQQQPCSCWSDDEDDNDGDRSDPFFKRVMKKVTHKRSTSELLSGSIAKNGSSLKLGEQQHQQCQQQWPRRLRSATSPEKDPKEKAIRKQTSQMFSKFRGRRSS